MHVTTPVTNIGVSVSPIINKLRIVAQIEVTLLVIDVVSADVVIVHVSCENTSRLADKQKINNIAQKSYLYILGLATKVWKDPFIKQRISVMGTMMKDCY